MELIAALEPDERAIKLRVQYARRQTNLHVFKTAGQRR